MWQFVFVAAVAGSGILVKHLFRNGERDGVSSVSEPKEEYPCSKTTTVEEEEEEEEEEENVMEVQRKEAGILSSCMGDSWLSEKQLHPVVQGEGGISSSSSIFRFTSISSSLDHGEEGSGNRSSNVDSVKRSTSSRGEKTLMMLEENQRSKGRRRSNVSFCLKRRRTGKIVFNKSKGNSLFSCGVGFGFMLSARKAVLNKLTVDIEETTEVISNLQDSICKDSANNMETMGMNEETLMVTEKLASSDYPEVLDLSSNGEYASSILTEEVDLEALEMDRLEAEFESELQKIPNEEDPEYFMDFPSTELSAYALEGSIQQPLAMDPNSSQCYGVSPTELDRKLCHVLIKQQECQIAELESNLYLSQMKLREKDAELRKLKAVVCSLRDFSLETASDDEVEEEEKEIKTNAGSSIYPKSNDDGSNKSIVVKEQKSICGAKRLMEFESYAIC